MGTNENRSLCDRSKLRYYAVLASSRVLAGLWPVFPGNQAFGNSSTGIIGALPVLMPGLGAFIVALLYELMGYAGTSWPSQRNRDTLQQPPFRQRRVESMSSQPINRCSFENSAAGDGADGRKHRAFERRS